MRRRRLRSVWLTSLLPLVAVTPSAAHDDDEPAAVHARVPTLTAVRAQAPIVVDGRLDDVAWTEATPAGGFRQRDPKEGEPATERTEVRVAYDDDALYVGLRLFDTEPHRIVRRLSRRDESADADRVTVLLDPHHDHLTGVQFQVSAAGVQSDAVLFNDSWDDSSWDAVWESAVTVDDQGWTAELRIPLSQLRFANGDRQTWGINVARDIHRKNENDWLELVPKNQSGVASRMAHLTGLDGLRPRRHLELLPYVVGRSELIAPASAGDPFNDGSRHFGALGLDLKYGLTSNLTLDATINPDFGQVEVDPAVVNLTEFETFFEEKRPFFIEGAQIFSNFGRNGANNFWGFNRSEPVLFYSRRIGRSPQGSADGDFVDRPTATTILGAGKLSGKTAGGWSVAALDAVTGREQARAFDDGVHLRHEVEPLTHYFVGRVHREWKRAGVGFLTTAVQRGLGDGGALAERIVDQAYVAGVDGYSFLDSKKEWVVTGRLAASRISGSIAAVDRVQRAPQRYFQRPDQLRLDPAARSLSGWTGSMNLNRNGGDFQVNAALWAVSPGFESSDLGFNFKADRWGAHTVVSYRKSKVDRFTRNRWIGLAKWYSLNFQGERQGDGFNVFSNAQFRNYWFVGLNGSLRRRVQNDQQTRGGPSMVSPAGVGIGAWAESDSRKRVTLNLETFYSRNEFGGWGWSHWASVKVKPSSSLNVTLGPGLTRTRAVAQYVTTVSDATTDATFGSRYVFSDLRQTELAMTARVNWILSPRMSLQVYLQPLLSVGDYEGFKELARPRSFDFNRYGSGGSTLVRDASGTYAVDPDGSGPAPPFTFDDPDFNFKSLRMNAVFRWEWRLGSTLYVVWTQQRQDSTTDGEFHFRRDASDLLGAPGDDVFLVKFTYRLGR
jgi:hypothetical protein